MNQDLGRLRVDAIIVHQVPFHLATGTSSDPILSDVESPITPDVQNFFRERIAGSLASAAYDVEFNAGSTSPVPRLVLSNLGAHPTGFVPMSQEMANHLYLCQNGSSPAGLLTVCQVTLEGRRGLAILKLEKEEGARILQTQVAGGLTFSVQHLRELMLTDTTKVYKVGLFVRSGARPGLIEGLVCDKQKGYSGGVAHFFLEQFLGCQLTELPQITTKRFYDAVETFINEDVGEPEVKAQTQIALLATMNGTQGTVSVRLFAQEHLGVQYRQLFMERMTRAHLPQTGFDKDLHLIRNHLRRIQMAFQSGVAILASPDSIGHQVKITDLPDGRTKVEVTDHMRQVSGKN